MKSIFYNIILFSILTVISLVFAVIPFSFFKLTTEYILYYLLFSFISTFSILVFNKNLNNKLKSILLILIFKKNKNVDIMDLIVVCFQICSMFIISSIPKNIYESAMIGLFSGGFVTVLILYFSYNEKKISLKQEIVTNYISLSYEIDKTLNSFSNVETDCTKNCIPNELWHYILENNRNQNLSLSNLLLDSIQNVSGFYDIGCALIDIFNKTNNILIENIILFLKMKSNICSIYVNMHKIYSELDDFTKNHLCFVKLSEIIVEIMQAESSYSLEDSVIASKKELLLLEIKSAKERYIKHKHDMKKLMEDFQRLNNVYVPKI